MRPARTCGPHLLRYGFRNSSQVLPAIFGDSELIRVANAKTVEDMVYMAVAYRWEAFTSGKVMYPKGGIRALPEAIAASIRARGGQIHVSTEASGVRQVASGFEVDCADGRTFAAAKVVMAAAMPWAAFALFGEDRRFDALRAAIGGRKAFPACFMSFLSLDPSFDPGGANYISDWADEGPLPSIWASGKAARGLGPATAPLACIVAGTGGEKEAPIAMTVMAALGYDYGRRWGMADAGLTSAGGAWRGAPAGYRASGDYLRIKMETQAIILDRLESRFGRGFREAIRFQAAATPISFARYTNSPGGSYMGFSIQAGEYGRFLPQRSPIPGLVFAGQWVFPGFGVGGAAASGYFAAKTLLADEGGDLDGLLRSLEA